MEPILFCMNIITKSKLERLVIPVSKPNYKSAKRKKIKTMHNVKLNISYTVDLLSYKNIFHLDLIVIKSSYFIFSIILFPCMVYSIS